MLTFYVFGMFVAFILSILLYVAQNKGDNSQIGMIAAISILSWISVILILWKFKDDLKKVFI